MNDQIKFWRVGVESLLIVAILGGLYLISQFNYLLFHSIVEAFTIVVGTGIFFLAWNTRAMLDNNYLLIFGIAQAFVSLIDLLHMLAYSGMGVFTDGGAGLSTQLWIAGRFLQAATLCAAPFFIGRRVRMSWILAAYSVVTALFIASIFSWGNFPVTYVEGVGLTPFKKISEFVLVGLFLLAAFLLILKRAAFSADILRLIVMSIFMKAIAEGFFAVYATAFDISTIAGHLFRLVSYYLMYKAMIETGMMRPYRVLFFNLKRSEEELQARSKELQERNEELDAFAHTVAHNLQNPLTAILLAAQAARNVNMSAGERNELMQEIAATARKMSNIIEALMMLAEVRRSEAPRERLEMGEILASVRRRLAHKIEAAQAEIHFPAEWPAAVGYAPWVEEVWANYLDNALKYGGKPPRIELGAEKLENGKVRFWVRDHGPGISPEQQAQLFHLGQRFLKRGDGHGLGLSIVRRVVEKLGGRAGVASEPGNGSEFYFTLPGE